MRGVVYSTLDGPPQRGSTVTAAPGAPGTQPGWTPPPPPPPPRAPREARWLPALISLAVLLFVAFGGFLVAGEPSAATEEITGDGGTPGQPIQLAPGVVIHPPPGWEAEPIPGSQELRLSNGIGQMYVVVSPVSGDPAQQLDAYRDEVLAPQASQLSTSQSQSIEIPSGNPAAYFSYMGTFNDVQAPLEGEVAAIVGPSGTAVILDGWASKGQFVAVQQDVRGTVAAAEVA